MMMKYTSAGIIVHLTACMAVWTASRYCLPLTANCLSASAFLPGQYLLMVAFPEFSMHELPCPLRYIADCKLHDLCVPSTQATIL